MANFGEELVEGVLAQLGEGALGGWLQRRLAPHAGHGRQGKIDNRVGVADLVSVPLQGIYQAAVVQAGNHQHPFVRPDAGLLLVSKAHSPAFHGG